MRGYFLFTLTFFYESAGGTFWTFYYVVVKLLFHNMLKIHHIWGRRAACSVVGDVVFDISVWLRPDRLIMWRQQQQLQKEGCTTCDFSKSMPAKFCRVCCASMSDNTHVWWCTTLSFVFNVFWCPYMAINVNVQYNGGFLPDIVLLTQCYLHRGTCLNAMKRFCICSLWSHLNVLTFSPHNRGMLRRSRCVLIFL